MTSKLFFLKKKQTDGLEIYNILSHILVIVEEGPYEKMTINSKMCKVFVN